MKRRINTTRVKSVVVKPAKAVKVKANETRANFRVRWDEAVFLAVVDITVLPLAHELWHLTSHGVAAVLR